LSGRAEYCLRQGGGAGDNACFASPAAYCAVSRLEPIHDTRLVGHLRFKQVPLAGVIVASWVIAFVEYCMAVPTSRRDVTPDLRLYLARHWGQ
jgi:Putative member of DMT superfamily (DUF486)